MRLYHGTIVGLVGRGARYGRHVYCRVATMGLPGAAEWRADLAPVKAEESTRFMQIHHLLYGTRISRIEIGEILIGAFIQWNEGETKVAIVLSDVASYPLDVVFIV